jgi:acetyl-CoA C-acetyltransferase
MECLTQTEDLVQLLGGEIESRELTDEAYVEVEQDVEPGSTDDLVDEGRTAFDGDLPVNPSGGVLSGNPTGATGLLRFVEAALQVRGTAGEHQVEGAPLAVGHAMGGASQFHAMWVVGTEAP